MRGERRLGFTLVETMFVMAVASIILAVLIQMFFGVQRNVGRAEETLDFLRQATILLDKVKNDIRGAGRGNSIELGAEGGQVTIRRETAEDGKEETIRYEFDATTRIVKRSASGGKRDDTDTFGSSGGKLGFINKFAVSTRSPRITVVSGDVEREVEVSGFYEVLLEFASESELKAAEEGKEVSASHTFRALVSRRAPEVRDDLWKPNE